MYSPRYYQVDAENAIVNYFNKGGKGNPVVVMPTGTGKSIVIASFIKNVLSVYPDQRIMMLTHVKELIKQNAEKLLSLWATAPLGVYSAGLNSRDMYFPVVFGGVQSVANAIKKSAESEYNMHFGHRDLLIVDECHLISPNESAMYNYVISALKKINPKLKVIGFTATPFRLKQGMITDDGLFTDICYDISGITSFNRLIDDGFLAPVVPRPTTVKLDYSNVKIVRGDFDNKQVEEIADTEKMVYDCVKEMISWGYNRKCWLVFGSSIDNSEHIAYVLNQFGVEAAACHSKLPAKRNDELINAYKAGELKALVNNNKLTTGFDNPYIDLIGVIRPLMSPGLWVQMLGRGTRPAPGKTDCLVLDFAGNTPRLGPINDPVIPSRTKKGSGDAPVKICPGCGNYVHASLRYCSFCGYEFTFESKLASHAGEMELIRKEEKPQKEDKIEYFKVHKVIYNLHEKKDKFGNLLSPPMIKVTYFAGMGSYNEYIMLEHGKLAGHQAKEWWKLRHHEEPPPTTYQALQKVAELKVPVGINVKTSVKYPEIISVEW